MNHILQVPAAPSANVLAQTSPDEKVFNEAMSIIVTAMVEGRVFKSAPKNTVAVIQAWTSALRGKVPLEWLKPTYEALVATGGWFPDASHFLDIAQSLMRADEVASSLEAVRALDEEDSQRHRSEIQAAGFDPDDPADPEFKEWIRGRISPEAFALLEGQILPDGSKTVQEIAV